MAEAKMVEQQIKGLLKGENSGDFSILTKPGSNTSSDNTET